ncbi:hypothetical protein LCGC14_0498480 [marine sediment metagenome]|uniref:Uncharacterized protein n=1 Tax=marine sediment metagenome TaxID=412755 RepID=A0A0F9S9P2_9ZZZZ
MMERLKMNLVGWIQEKERVSLLKVFVLITLHGQGEGVAIPHDYNQTRPDRL